MSIEIVAENVSFRGVNREEGKKEMNSTVPN